MTSSDRVEALPVHQPSRYDADTYFIETCDALAALDIDRDAFAYENGILLLKPDAAVTGAMKSAIDWLVEHDYRIVGAAAVQLTYLHLRALWYFNWHKATSERRKVADRLAGLSPSLVLVVRHPDDGQPVSVRLTADKGPADPALRKPGELRHALAAGTYLLNKVHTPDDPDDVLRELSIYFPEPTLSAVISACVAGADATSDAVGIVDGIESGLECKSGDLAAAQDAIWHGFGEVGMGDRPRNGEEWLAALADAEKRDIGVDPWFRIVVESSYLPMHR
ncbi:nucleoside diphosphate kinase [Mycolicibacterium sp. BK634]|uniref:nucleoside-diphosphate kinase n=1 Tax=Mycolicibacterium sp. BK634 TaxID=2587099 RepID=UPI00160C03FD|nr:nucleoside-diphosphate kinase [Mycolicibacterium sp. BK634]MBB3747903.1 nucleoside diphosphate kinase [Mycolicibacterium sp. BK634]